ncbi:MAG: ABC transporter permease [Deltaproteobacteria bacterium]|nr:ABC transporter permease [Deltaproteobacteria bacterium]
MVSRTLFFLRLAFSALGRSFGVTALAVVTIAVSLTVLATFSVVVRHLGRLTEGLGRQVEISVYLARGQPEERIRALSTDIAAWPEVARTRVLSSEAALAEFRVSLGPDAALLEGLPEDLLPPSIEFALKPGDWAVSAVQSIAARLNGRPEVDDVRFGQEDIERLAALFSFTRLVAIVLGAALCFATILIVSNTIRLTVYARRDEIEILTLVGATGWFVRVPFFIEGAVQGVIGGALSGVVLVAFGEAFTLAIERGLGYLYSGYSPVTLDFVPLEYLGLLVLVGGLLGVVGSLLAVGKFLRL